MKTDLSHAAGLFCYKVWQGVRQVVIVSEYFDPIATLEEEPNSTRYVVTFWLLCKK
jgi:hypothetical protein